MGWWSDVLADAIQRSGTQDRRVLQPSEGSDAKFAVKYRLPCRAVLRGDARRSDIAAIITPHPNGTHLETTRERAARASTCFLDKPIANTIAEARALTRACRDAKVVLALVINGGAKATSAGERRRSTQEIWASSLTPKPTSSRIVGEIASLFVVALITAEVLSRRRVITEAPATHLASRQARVSARASGDGVGRSGLSRNRALLRRRPPLAWSSGGGVPLGVVVDDRGDGRSSSISSVGTRRGTAAYFTGTWRAFSSERL